MSRFLAGLLALFWVGVVDGEVPREMKAKEIKPGDYVMFDPRIKGWITGAKNLKDGRLSFGFLAEATTAPSSPGSACSNEDSSGVATPVVGFLECSPDQEVRIFTPSEDFKREVKEYKERNPKYKNLPG